MAEVATEDAFKMEVGEMKKLMILATVVLCLALLVPGCGGGDGNGSVVIVPEITGVYYFVWDTIDPIALDEFYMGQRFQWMICVENPELDNVTLLIDQFHPNTATEAYYSEAYALPHQYASDRCYSNVEVAQVLGPAGTWRIEWTIVEKDGYESPVWVDQVIVN